MGALSIPQKKIIVVGGDGFCGWPLSLRLSNLGHDVLIVDNLSRRTIDSENGTNSLTPIASIEDRVAAWKEVSDGKLLSFRNIDVAHDIVSLVASVVEFKPNVIFHLGEQRAAPYSMKNTKTACYTVDNNINATHNILRVITDVDRSIHLVHIGTMGVYGYGEVEGSVIPEGYIEALMPTGTGLYEQRKILYPAYPGSIYHLTKAQDALFFQFYAKNYHLAITDLHQGIIWGLATKETDMHPKLINRFDYDGDYGTVLNRFIFEAAVGHPLTIYGTGEQTRAFIHIENSMNCLQIAMENPPKPGDKVLIINQITETHTLGKLADLIVKLFPGTQVTHLENPRKELVSNKLEAENQYFLEHGLEPIYLKGDELIKIYNYIKENHGTFEKEKILPLSTWD